MSSFDLNASFKRAQQRFGPLNTSRKVRADRGSSRLAPEVNKELQQLLMGYERPPLRTILNQLRQFCARRQLRCPTRSTLYKLMATTEGHSYLYEQLPPHIGQVLYNFEPGSVIPGHQLAFYCFNYGDLRAISFAAGLPWLDLYQARRMHGFRPMARGPLEAVTRVRRI